MKTIKPNDKEYKSDIKIFLAGTIDMGNSEDWQKDFEESMRSTDVVIFNPRRDDWDSSWEQSIENKEFNHQVNWEIDHIESSDMIIFNIGKDSKSPITLLELGYVLGKMPNKMIFVCCPKGFYRKGNVDIMCNRSSVRVYEEMAEMLSDIKDIIKFM